MRTGGMRHGKKSAGPSPETGQRKKTPWGGSTWMAFISPLFDFHSMSFFVIFGGKLDTFARRRRVFPGSCAVCSEMLGSMGRYWSCATARAPPAWIVDAELLGGVCARRSILYLVDYGRFNSPVSRGPGLRIASGRQRIRISTAPTIGYMSPVGGTLRTCLYLEHARFHPEVPGVSNYAIIPECPASRFLLRYYGRYSDYVLTKRGSPSYRMVDV